MPDPKEKPAGPHIKERTPKKRTADPFPNLRRPTDDIGEILGIPSQPIPTEPNQTQVSPTRPIAPARDYNKRANSLERDALPSGLFPGTSKKLYDALYMRTRGAVVPVRTIQARKRELMAWSGIRSKNTIAVNLQLLTANGLIRKQLEIGDHDGSVYEVFLPEEATQPNPSQPNPTHPDPTRKLGGDPTQQLGWDGMGKTVDGKEYSGDDKTSFKTNTEKTDDDAFADFVSLLAKAAKDITGREPTSAERARWAELADLLVTELKIAAGRTTVSSVPAFLAEHLRRRLWKKDKAQLESEEKSSPVPAVAQIDASQCPDCGGTGYHYPEGFDKGVARCRHLNLSKTSEGKP